LFQFRFVVRTVLVVSPFHRIVLYKSTFTYVRTELLTSLCRKCHRYNAHARPRRQFTIISISHPVAGDFDSPLHDVHIMQLNTISREPLFVLGHCVCGIGKKTSCSASIGIYATHALCLLSPFSFFYAFRYCVFNGKIIKAV